MKKKLFYMVGLICIAILSLVLASCTSTFNAVKDIPPEILCQIGWSGNYSITSYDGTPVNWSGNSKDGSIFVNLPAGEHTLEAHNYDTDYLNNRREFKIEFKFDFKPNRIYKLYCQKMVTMEEFFAGEVGEINWTITDVTDKNDKQRFR